MEWPSGYNHRHYDILDSTNEAARRLAAEGENGPLWITAGAQTAGRGRRGRAWVSRSGNLFSTLLLRPDRPLAECPQLSFVSALAAADAVASLAPNTEVRVKWPNDVLVGGKKIAGILLESAGAGGEPHFFAIGIGINLAHSPADTEFPATSLAGPGATSPSPTEAIGQLATHFAGWYDVWRGTGFAPIRDAWLARAVGLGRRIRVRLTNEETSGVFEGIDETGALLLRQGVGCLRTIAAGEVFF